MKTLILALAALVLLGCGSPPRGNRVSLWVHAGPGPERLAYVEAVRVFNAAGHGFQVDLTVLPEGTYGDQVRAAALAGQLPDVLELDGPAVPEYAWAKRLLPLDGFPELAAAREDALPSIREQGTFRGRLYALGPYESGLALWGNRRLLAKAGVAPPATVDGAWTLPQFEAVMRRLKRVGVPYPLDMKFNYGAGEWFTFALAPLVQGLGGDLLDPAWISARGHLDGPAAVRALALVQGWARAGYVNAATRDDSDFVMGRAALSYVGHWAYPTYRRALGRDLVLLPMPRFGPRAVTGAGTWTFALSSGSRHPAAAAQVLAHLLSPAEIARVTAINGAIPGTFTALRASAAHRPGGPLALYAEQVARGLARPRPRTPAYATVSAAFAEAVNNVLAGADPRTELGRAATTVEEALQDSRGFPGT